MNTRKGCLRMEYKDLSPSVLGEEKLRVIIQEKTAVGAKELPSERTLGIELGISRTSLRRSLDVLEKEGAIKKNNREGMEINEKQTINLLAMNSMSEQLNNKNQQQSIQVLDSGLIAGQKEINLFLQLSARQKLFELKRKRAIDGQPFMYEISYLNAEQFSGIEALNFENRSLYSALKERFGVTPTYGREEIRFIRADQSQAKLLEVPLHTPLFEITSKAFDQNDEPIEYSKQYLIGNQVTYKINATNIFDYLEDEEEQ